MRRVLGEVCSIVGGIEILMKFSIALSNKTIHLRV
jgi:hypothetical protein